MNIDDRQLIDLVRQFEVLFNKRHIDFKNKNIRGNAWTTIGEVLGTTGNACEQRFNVLRTKYNVERKKMQTIPSDSGCSKEWELYKPLTFLDSHIVSRKTMGNVASTPLSLPSTSAAASVMKSMTMTADDVEAETVPPEYVFVVSESTSGDGAEYVQEKEMVRRHKRTKKHDLSSTLTNALEKMHSLLDQQQTNTEDSDVAFGTYVGLELRGLQNAAIKRRLKSKITMLMQEAYEEDEAKVN